MTHEEKLERLIDAFTKPEHVRDKYEAYLPVPANAPITEPRHKFAVAATLEASGKFSRVVIG